MNYIIKSIIFILFFPAFVFSQDTTFTYKKGEEWLQETRSIKVVTKVDTVVAKSLINKRIDLSRELYYFLIDSEKNIKRLRKEIKYSTKEIRTLFPNAMSPVRDTIKGSWLLNGEAVSISNDKIKNKKITWISEFAFEWENEYFIKQENGNWVSEQFKLVKIKLK